MKKFMLPGNIILASLLFAHNVTAQNDALEEELFADGSISFQIQATNKGESSLMKIENKILGLAQISFFDPVTKDELVHILSGSSHESKEALAKIAVPFSDLNDVSPSFIIPKALSQQKSIGLRLTHVNGEQFEYTFRTRGSTASTKITLSFP